jgi:hypothetical protein
MSLLYLLGLRTLNIYEQKSLNDRYQLYIHPQYGKFQYLLDTRTGLVWQSVEYVDIKSKPIVWNYMWKIDTPEQQSTFYSLMK